MLGTCCLWTEKFLQNKNMSIFAPQIWPEHQLYFFLHCEPSWPWKNIVDFYFILFIITGTFVVQVTATDADDPTYGNSAKVVYSILQGQPYFSVESETGQETLSVILWQCL